MFENFTPQHVIAPLVSLAALLAIAWVMRGPRSRTAFGPAADTWETVRGSVLPLLDRVARDRLPGNHYAAYELASNEIVGTIDAPPERVEEMLYAAGFRRMPLAAYKTLPDGRGEIGSWAYRDSLLAKKQTHVMLFDGAVDGQTLVAAHREFSALNPFVARKHYRGVDYSPADGKADVRRRLDEGVWAEA